MAVLSLRTIIRLSDVAERELDAVGELAADDAGAGDLVGGGDGEQVGPFGLSARHGVEDGEQDRQLDGAGGADRIGLVDADGDAGVEIFGVEGDGAREVADAGAQRVLRANRRRGRRGEGGEGRAWGAP